MKKAYMAPQLVEYGLLSQLTLGAGGQVPDITITGGPTNTNCPSSTWINGNGGTSSRVACVVASS